MPEYDITSPSGRTITISGAVPPTQSEAEEIFSNLEPATETTEPAKDPRNISFDEFKKRKKIEDEKSFGEQAGEFVGGVASGVGQIFQTGAGAISETAEAVSAGDFQKILKSFPEGVAKAMFDLSELGEAIGGRAGDVFVGEEESLMRQFERSQQDILDAEKRQEGLLFGAEETLPQLTEVASIVGDPTNLIGLGVAGKVAKASRLGQTAQRAGEILDLPNKAVRAGLGAGVSKTAGAVSSLLQASEKPLKAVSKASKKLEKVAKKPRTMLQSLTEKTLLLQKGKLDGVSKVGLMMGGPFGKVLLGSELIGNKGAKLYKQSRDAQKIANIMSNPEGRLSFLQAVATNPSVSKGIRRFASSAKTEKAMNIAINSVTNGVSAGILQGVFAKLATDDIGAIGQAVGGGLAFGGLAPVGTRGGRGAPAQKGDFTELPVSLDPTQRARDLEALEIERQANPRNFRKEKANLDTFVDAFDKKGTDAGIGSGKEGTTFPDGVRELYASRGEGESLINMDKAEQAIKGDGINTITFVRTGATKKQARGQLESKIETITQDVAIIDVQIPKSDNRNKTLTNIRGINTDTLRQIANERNVDMNFLLGELVTLKQHIRQGGNFNDKGINSNAIVKLVNDGEKSLLIQIEPRNIVNMGDKPLASAQTPPPVTPTQEPTPSQVRPTPSQADPSNVPDFRGNAIKSKSLPRGRGERITSRFKTGADRSLFDFHGIRFRKKGSAQNRESNAPKAEAIRAEQEFLASVYGIPVDQVPALAQKFNESVKATGKKLHKEDKDSFNAIDPRTLL